MLKESYDITRLPNSIFFFFLKFHEDKQESLLLAKDPQRQMKNNQAELNAYVVPQLFQLLFILHELRFVFFFLLFDLFLFAF